MSRLILRMEEILHHLILPIHYSLLVELSGTRFLHPPRGCYSTGAGKSYPTRTRLCDQRIASHVLLAYNTASQTWGCVLLATARHADPYASCLNLQRAMPAAVGCLNSTGTEGIHDSADLHVDIGTTKRMQRRKMQRLQHTCNSS